VQDDVDDLAGDDDHSGNVVLWVARVLGQQVGDLGLAGGGGDLDAEPALAVDLDGQGHGGLGGQGGVRLRERLVRQRGGVAQPLPQLLGDVRGQRRHHQDQRLG
jgi:hypothetical protein